MDRNSTTPALQRNGCQNWNSNEFLTRLFQGDLSNTVVAWRLTDINKSKTYMEYESTLVRATFRQFFEWYSSISKSGSESSEISPFYFLPDARSGVVSVYGDYLHFAEIFTEDQPKVGNWSKIFSEHHDSAEILPEDLTLWVSTVGAHSPLHYDSYGVNVIAQLEGQKRWKLWAPNHPRIPPKRIPYEESSIYSFYDPACDTSVEPDFDILLNEGDILFVPKHWWHYVTTVSNIYIPCNYYIISKYDKKTLRFY